MYLIHKYFCWKNVSSFCKCKSYTNFFSKNISVYAIFKDQSFNDTLTNNTISFEQVGPGFPVLTSQVNKWAKNTITTLNIQTLQLFTILILNTSSIGLG